MVKSYDIFLISRKQGTTFLEEYLANRLMYEGYTVMPEKMSEQTDWEEINREIQQSRNIVCLLTEHALDPCVEETDIMRKEIVCALQNRKNMIPVMTENFVFPQELPEDIVKLSRYCGVVLKMEYMDGVIRQLISRLEK